MERKRKGGRDMKMEKKREGGRGWERGGERERKITASQNLTHSKIS